MSRSKRVQKLRRPQLSVEKKNSATGQARVAVQQVRASSFSGPLPPPEIVARYNDAVPNGAERVFAMAEREQRARHRQSSILLWTKAIGELAGVFIGGGLVVGAGVLALYLARLGMDGASIATIISAAGLLLTRIALVRRAQVARDKSPKHLELPLD